MYHKALCYSFNVNVWRDSILYQILQPGCSFLPVQSWPCSAVLFQCLNIHPGKFKGRPQNYVEQSLPSELYSKALPYCFNVQICRNIFTVKLIDNIGHPFTILIFFLLMGCKVNVSMPFYTEHQNNFPHMQQIILSSLFFSPYPYLYWY